MWKCKWNGDKDDVYCANCNGVTMEVDGKEISCEECNGYEEGSEEVETETKEEVMEEQKEPEKETQKDDFTKDMNEPEPDTTTERTETVQKQTKKSNPTNTTSNDKKAKENENKKVEKVNEEKKAVEKTTKDENGQVKVVSIRYTSGATIKKGDNYVKFVAEEEWDVSQVNNVDDVREQLWAKLNGEVDKQIEELQNMN